jgi:transcriptional regulator of acetoin/glycerol metabolism
VGPDISDSWQRSRETHRIDPRLASPSRVLLPDALSERTEGNDVLDLAGPVLRDFASRLHLSDHALAFFDAEGWMLSIDGDPDVVGRLATISFRPGVNWSEDSAGTNGPGTALAAGKPMEVFASEHYVESWWPWSCAASPIFVPGNAMPVGIVDITGPWEVRRRQALLSAKAIARAVEERLRAAASVRDEVVRYAFRLAHESGDALVAVDARGRVLVANEAALRRRIVDAGALPPGIRDTLCGVLRSRALAFDGDLRLDSPEGRSVAVSVVRHENARVGAILRVNGSAGAPRRVVRPPHPSARYDFARILCRSEPMQQALELARAAAQNELPVVVSGESGTGKELFAHSIHAASGRQGGPFVAVNCGSIPAQLIEAELFGYEAGAYTGAKKEGSAGRFEDANGGTLLLDEVSELTQQAQTALLRVLQEKEVVRLGSSVPRRVDVRVVAATNKLLEEEIRQKRFRRDLYYRLNVLPISIPPLRERGDDLLLLAQVFLADAEVDVGRRPLTLSADAIEVLRSHSWPGNVRELKNVILRAAATAPNPEITARDLLVDPQAPRPAADRPRPEVRKFKETVLLTERSALLEALEACGWNYARTARHLGISRMTLYRMLGKCNISRAVGRG